MKTCFIALIGLSVATVDGAATPETKSKWNSPGFKQANSMGGGETPIPKSGKFRVLVLMGQSNMTGSARAKNLKPPYTERHDRIRIWANGRWEYFVPTNRFGPGVSLAHQLADFWPEDTTGIIKISIGGTGIRAFEKDWSFERADRTFDGKKGPLYQDLMNAAAEAMKISDPEFNAFVWKQGGADGTKKDLAHEYFDTFTQLVTDLRTDLGAPDLPVIIPVNMNEEELLETIMAGASDQQLAEARKSAEVEPQNKSEFLGMLVAHMENNPYPELDKRMKKGDSIKGLLGWEWHGAPAMDLPGMNIVAEGDATINGRTVGQYSATLYDGPKDNVVFNAATIWWANGLSSPPGHVNPSRHGVQQQGPDERVKQITHNLFQRFINS
jgi:hypothetical protein